MMTIVMKMMTMAIVMMVMVNRAMHLIGMLLSHIIVIGFSKFVIITSSL